MKTKKVAGLAMLLAISMIFSYVEVLIPIAIGIPGIKLGLANLVVLMGLYCFQPGEILMISLARIFLTSFLFGNMTMLIYSLAGGVFSFVIMFLFIKCHIFSMTGVSIVGAVSHNIAQIMIAVLVVESFRIIVYLPVLLISGAVAGLAIGILGQRCIVLVRKVL